MPYHARNVSLPCFSLQDVVYLSNKNNSDRVKPGMTLTGHYGMTITINHPRRRST